MLKEHKDRKRHESFNLSLHQIVDLKREYGEAELALGSINRKIDYRNSMLERW